MFKKTEPHDACAASVQTIGTKFQTDSLMQILSREDLQRLFPGAEHLKLRKTIYEILHDQKQTQEFLKYLKSCIHQNSLNDAAVTVYLQRINNIKDQLDQMQTVLEAHKMQKDINKSQVSQKGSSSDTKALMKTNGMQREEQRRFSFLPFFSSLFSSVDDPPPKISETVKYKMVVGDKTFGAHLQLLDQIQTSGLNLIKGKDEESCITIVFCPLTSRIGTDAEAAMRTVPADDRVILVLMHYSQEPKNVSSLKVLPHHPNIVSEVQVFYHDRKNGLLRCEQNEKAVIELKEELIKYSRPQCSGPNYENQSNSFTFL
ncbi:uncharacterized protein LOC118598133 isoform X2 [Oryzias melastigma]|uniref:uncharacterized protein LOC118598133 isoform X2 n=1 Tax=Oryzias melastigma TaxID=30732 RepID=UPI00168D6F4D|nr:uncharacterized protein LOC118598133 isoform X2 [Oryzias melastigma]